ncbi:transcription regulator protein BACH1-like [Thalassophryne amazonica]|uniref:transcription regulator protein BACH1-like n=1 Tax=Thalassophryne amazonica TaxID=390379 RepID=UPI001471D1BE|nr:transcription regulator protein BACH1-like [Thalassophryne amazonica]XP_034024323.1 transcription regulator protein BACH1-like [Thalassophryne amazonica]
MSLQEPRVSVFTFQSAVHSAHVLQCLNEQRERDILCDVTVMVENRSFQAHCSVLASCSAYFHNRFTNFTRHNSIITLPDEVTVDGFEPLLQFAYTSKLLFTKENIQAIHSSAQFLGFHSLESACFDFLIPKFSEGRRATQVHSRRVCCKSRNPSGSFGPSVESSQPQSSDSPSSVSSKGDEQADFQFLCPQSATKSEEEHLNIDHCGPQVAPLTLQLTENGICPMLPLPCSNSDKADHSSEFCDRNILGMDVCNQSKFTLSDCDLTCELSNTRHTNLPELIHPAGKSIETVETLGAETNCNPALCPINASEPGDCCELSEKSQAGLVERVMGELSEPTLTEEAFEERSSVEREVAEHLAKGFWPDSHPSQVQPLPLDAMNQNSLAKASDFHWLKQLDLSATVGDCPFLRDLDAGDDPPPQTDNLSQSEKSPCMSSALNSADDSDLDTDGDSEANNKKAAEMKLPFSVQEISELTRSDFQQLLKRQHLSQEQLEFVQDVRRRSKNRVAAQRCRKRKLDGIQQLECEINTLRNEKERLLCEQTQLENNLEEARQSLCGLCATLNIDCDSEQDYPQLLAKLSSSYVNMPSAGLLAKNEHSDNAIEMVSCSSECDPLVLPADSIHYAVAHTEEQQQVGSPQSCPVPTALLSACLDINEYS